MQVRASSIFEVVYLLPLSSMKMKPFSPMQVRASSIFEVVYLLPLSSMKMKPFPPYKCVHFRFLGWFVLRLLRHSYVVTSNSGILIFQLYRWVV
jgi:hypothetical protein